MPNQKGRKQGGPLDISSIAKVLSINIDEKRRDRYQVACWLLDRTISDVAREAIDKYLEPFESQIQAVLMSRAKAAEEAKTIRDSQKSTGQESS